MPSIVRCRLPEEAVIKRSHGSVVGPSIALSIALSVPTDVLFPCSRTAATLGQSNKVTKHLFDGVLCIFEHTC